MTASNPDGRVMPTLAAELKAMVMEQVNQRIDRMFREAGARLLEMAERSRNNAEQRRYMDAKHLMRKHRDALVQGFNREFAGVFRPGAKLKNQPESPDISFDELRMCQTRSIEESIAVNNIALKVEADNETPLWEIGRRMEWLAKEGGAEISPTALAPAALCNSFRVSTQSLNLDFQVELVIFKLFEVLVASELKPVYTEALQFLDRGGVTAAVLKRSGPARLPRPGGHSGAHPVTAPSSPPAAASASTTATGAAVDAMTAGMPAMDRGTFEALRSAQGLSSTRSYGDAELAGDLVQVASGQPVAGWGVEQARASVQAADLVGRMFGGILEDPHVHGSLKPQLEQLRFDVIKTAISDRRFFSNSDHPIRRLLDELATMAASARTTDASSLERLSDLLGSIRSQFQIAALVVKAAAASAVPLPPDQAERFLEEQLIKNKQRRQALIERARRVVQEEVQLRMAGHEIPAPARPMVAAGLTPLLGLRLLRHGIGSEAWNSGLALLDKVIGALDARPGFEIEAAPDSELCPEVERELLAAGMTTRRSAELVEGLREGLVRAATGRQAPAPTIEMPALPREGAEPEPPTPPPPRPDHLLRQLLVPGDWFKVHDPGHAEKRWLKVDALYLDDARPEFRDRVSFVEFSGKNPLHLPVDDLLDDIAAGLSEPFDQSPAARAALAELVRIQLARAATTPDLAL